jgi:hypothetical protein
MTHFSKRFTFELWIKLFNLNVTLLTKDFLVIEIQNGLFVVRYLNKQIPPLKTNDYKLPVDKWTHIVYTYKSGKLKFYINCEESVCFNLTLTEEVGLKGDIHIGNSILDAEVTEIRIWNHEIPMKFIKESYKSPLPILADNKRKLRMKINKQEENNKKKTEFVKPGANKFQSFSFPQKNLLVNKSIDITDTTIIKKEVQSQNKSGGMIIEEESQPNLNISEIRADESTIQNRNNLYEFNPLKHKADTTELYPSLSIVLRQDKNEQTTNKVAPEFEFNERDFNFGNPAELNNTLQLEYNKEDFNFDK